MDRRKFTVGSGMTAAAALAVSPARGQGGAQVRWRMASSFPRTLGMYQAAEIVAKRVEALTGGHALFYLRSVAPKSVTSSDIYWGAAPYLVIQLLMVGALIAFPQLVGTHAKKDIDTKGVEIPTLEQPGYAPPLFGAPPGQ